MPNDGAAGLAQTNAAEGRLLPFRVDFIDPLFAVAIHIGIVEGIIGQKWFVEWRFPRGPELLSGLVFLLGMWTLVSSWLGYHQSIRDKPLKGLLRFIVDVLLVLLYALMLVKFENLGAVLLLLGAIYSLFVVWDFGKYMEYGKWGRREVVTIGWCVVFWLLVLAYSTRRIADPVGLGLAFGCTVLYRVNKRYAIWGGLGTNVKHALFRFAGGGS